jgi:tetratricopeptide (TPR) repeat protein
MYEAHTYIGYVNRKLGNHVEALGAYDTALRLKPDYARAIEYQGEAYLALDRFEDAKRNYLRLYALDQAQADTLLSAMHDWAMHDWAMHERPHSRITSDTNVATNAAEWLKTRPCPQASAHRLSHW